MHEQDMAIVKALVPIAWADGVFANVELEMVEALLDAYQATDAEKKVIHEYASSRRTLDDIDPQDLSADDRRTLLQHAVLLTFVDGSQAAGEAELLRALSEKLRIPSAEATGLIDAAAARAKRLLHLVGS